MSEVKPSKLVFFACTSCNTDGKSYVVSWNAAYISLEQLHLIPIGLLNEIWHILMHCI